MILARDTKRQSGETRDRLTRTSRTAKKARAKEATREHPRRGECFHLHSRSRILGFSGRGCTAGIKKMGKILGVFAKIRRKCGY